ncbi:MAG: PspA-associated protein PspAA [Chloroflexota bacterium]
MIVRISGLAQYELDDTASHRLEALDRDLTQSLEKLDDARFHELLHSVITFIQENGSEVSHDRIIPSDVIIPPEDITAPEARTFFTDEGLMEPLPA